MVITDMSKTGTIYSLETVNNYCLKPVLNDCLMVTLDRYNWWKIKSVLIGTQTHSSFRACLVFFDGLIF